MEPRKLLVGQPVKLLMIVDLPDFRPPTMATSLRTESPNSQWRAPDLVTGRTDGYQAYAYRDERP